MEVAFVLFVLSCSRLLHGGILFDSHMHLYIFEAEPVRADKLVTEDVVPKTYQHFTKDQDDVSHSNFVLHSIRELKSVIYDWSPYRCFVVE